MDSVYVYREPHCSQCVHYEPCSSGMYCKHLKRRITARKSAKNCDGYLDSCLADNKMYMGIKDRKARDIFSLYEAGKISHIEFVGCMTKRVNELTDERNRLIEKIEEKENEEDKM